MRLLEYRRTKNEETKAKDFIGIHKCINSGLLRSLMTVVGLFLVIFDLTIARSAVADPYSWTMSQNIMYYSFTRWTYVIGGFLIAFSIFFSPNSFIREFLRRPFFMMAGSLCFLNALITPLVIQLNYNSLPDGLFVSFYVVIELGLANAMLITTFSFLLYLLI
jgi:hypothetical protein